MLGYLIKKHLRLKVRVSFKDGFDCSGYLYVISAKNGGWWALKNLKGYDRVKFHSVEVSKVSLFLEEQTLTNQLVSSTNPQEMERRMCSSCSGSGSSVTCTCPARLR